MNTSQLNGAAINSAATSYGNIRLTGSIESISSTLAGGLGISPRLTGAVSAITELTGAIVAGMFLKDGVSSSASLFGSIALIPYDTQYNTGALSIKSVTVALTIKTPLKDT